MSGCFHIHGNVPYFQVIQKVKVVWLPFPCQVHFVPPSRIPTVPSLFHGFYFSIEKISWMKWAAGNVNFHYTCCMGTYFQIIRKLHSMEIKAIKCSLSFFEMHAISGSILKYNYWIFCNGHWNLSSELSAAAVILYAVSFSIFCFSLKLISTRINPVLLWLDHWELHSFFFFFFQWKDDWAWWCYFPPVCKLDKI